MVADSVDFVLHSYQYGLGERIRERVDAMGHVALTDKDASTLSRTKALCIVLTVCGIFVGVLLQSAPANVM